MHGDARCVGRQLLVSHMRLDPAWMPAVPDRVHGKDQLRIDVESENFLTGIGGVRGDGQVEVERLGQLRVGGSRDGEPRVGRAHEVVNLTAEC